MSVEFLWGALAMGCAVAGLYFLRSWRDTRDRLFALFAIAFWVLGANWVSLDLFLPGEETRHYFFVVRLIAFGFIAVAVVDKNRRRRGP